MSTSKKKKMDDIDVLDDPNASIHDVLKRVAELVSQQNGKGKKKD